MQEGVEARLGWRAQVYAHRHRHGNWQRLAGPGGPAVQSSTCTAAAAQRSRSAGRAMSGAHACTLMRCTAHAVRGIPLVGTVKWLAKPASGPAAHPGLPRRLQPACGVNGLQVQRDVKLTLPVNQPAAVLFVRQATRRCSPSPNFRSNGPAK